MSAGQWLLLLATSASFASSILLNKVLVEQLPPFTLAALRVLLAMPIGLAAAMLLGRPLPRERRDRVAVVAASLGVIVVPYCALAIGQQTIASGLSAILYPLTPLFTLLIAHAVLHDERLDTSAFVGLALIVGGSLLITRVPRVASARAEPDVPASPP